MKLLTSASTLILVYYVFIVNTYKMEIKIGSLKKKRNAMKYLYDYGYFPSMCSSETCGMTKEDEKVVIKNFQDFANLKQTGEFDDATIQQMEVPRCGKSDEKFAGFVDRRQDRYRRFNPQGSKWNKVSEGTALTWRYAKPNTGDPTEGITEDLPREDVIVILKKAMSMWSKHTEILFTEDNDEEPDIWIYFQGGSHGDPFPFDGPGRTLAHAFYPLNNRGLAGDMHFDDAERFTHGTAEGRNLLWIATHELGHSLGLAHSNVREAVMFPWYTGFQGDFKLKEDDILGIQSIYGKKKIVTTVGSKTDAPTLATTTTTSTSAPTGEYCPPKEITALWHMPEVKKSYISTSQGNYAFLSDGDKPVLNPVGQFESAIDAAFSLRLDDNAKESVIIFSGEHYFVTTEGFKIVSGPHSIHDLSKGGPLKLKFPDEVVKINAALKWKRNDKLYLFYRYNGVGYYRKYDLKDNSIHRDRRGRVYWNTEVYWGLPKSGPDAGISVNGIGTYFVIGEKMYKYDDWAVRVQEGYPKPLGSDDFFNCNDSEYMP